MRKRKKHICTICKRELTSKKKLEEHIKFHLKNLKELKMLEEGYIPSQTKKSWNKIQREK